MTPFEYQKAALRTESTATVEEVRERITPETLRLWHASCGFCTEAGEFLDVLKKYFFYGKDLDRDQLVNLFEEIGDLMWYVALGCEGLGVDLGDVMIKNIAKLKARYPEKFTEGHALNRNLEAENDTLR